MKRIVTVTGDAIKNPRNFLVYVGTPYTELVEAAGGFVSEPEKMISGGPMMGFAMYSLNVPVTKNTSSLLAFTHDTVKDNEESPCIRCGRCGEVCPGEELWTHLLRISVWNVLSAAVVHIPALLRDSSHSQLRP